VEIKDDVQIGVNCNIDRGTYGKTILSRGVKLDSLCHVAQTMLHRCGVTEDIPEKGMWAGTPPKPFREYVSNLNSYKRLKSLEKRVNRKIAKLEAMIDKA